VTFKGHVLGNESDQVAIKVQVVYPDPPSGVEKRDGVVYWSDLQKEVHAMQRLHSKNRPPSRNPAQNNIVRFRGMVLLRGYGYIVMDLYDDNLADYLRKLPVIMDRAMAQSILKQVLAGVEFMHSNGICHEDLHAGNVLVRYINSNLGIRGPLWVGLADFGIVVERPGYCDVELWRKLLRLIARVLVRQMGTYFGPNIRGFLNGVEDNITEGPQKYLQFLLRYVDVDSANFITRFVNRMHAEPVGVAGFMLNDEFLTKPPSRLPRMMPASIFGGYVPQPGQRRRAPQRVPQRKADLLDPAVWKRTIASLGIPTPKLPPEEESEGELEEYPWGIFPPEFSIPRTPHGQPWGLGKKKRWGKKGKRMSTNGCNGSNGGLGSWGRMLQTIGKPELSAEREALEHPKTIVADGVTYVINYRAPLGSGGFATAFRGHVEGDQNDEVAIKRQKKDTWEMGRSYETERDSMIRFRDAGGHPNVVRLRGSVIVGDYAYFVMDLYDLDLKDYLISYPGNLPQETARSIIKQATGGLYFMHRHGVCHGDLHSGNLLVKFLDEDHGILGPIRVAWTDYGWANLWSNYCGAEVWWPFLDTIIGIVYRQFSKENFDQFVKQARDQFYKIRQQQRRSKEYTVFLHRWIPNENAIEFVTRLIDAIFSQKKVGPVLVRDPYLQGGSAGEGSQLTIQGRKGKRMSANGSNGGRSGSMFDWGASLSSAPGTPGGYGMAMTPGTPGAPQESEDVPMDESGGGFDWGMM